MYNIWACFWFKRVSFIPIERHNINSKEEFKANAHNMHIMQIWLNQIAT